MRIGIEFLFASVGSTQGYDSCTKNLLSGLNTVSGEHEITVFCNTPYYLENKNRFSNLHLFDCQGNWQNRSQRALWMSTSLPGIVHRFGLDGMYFPTHFRPINNFQDVWTVFNIHDLQYRYIPQSFGRIQVIIRDSFYRLSLSKSDRCICISEYVKNTVKEQFPSIPADRLIVISNPIAFDTEMDFKTEETREVLGLRPYILTIGKHFPHKNIETLLRAFAIIIRKTHYQGSLIIAGSFTSHTPSLRKLAADLKITNQVIFMGYVSNLLKESLYKSADIFVFPSLYEGFGMPVIEAMGHKIPVVCSDNTALPEVTLGLANYYSQARDAEALAQAIIKIQQQPPTRGQLQDISNHVRLLYDSKTISKQYLALWESLSQ